MNLPTEITALLQRFIDDRDALTEEELARLVAAAKEQPELLVQLRDQLRIDNALSQQQALDRRNFPAQVAQRVADYLRGEDELNQQAEELRELALSRVGQQASEGASHRSLLFSWGAALCLLVAVGVGLALWQQQEGAELLVRVEQATGKVVIRREHDHDQYAQANLPLRPGDRLLVQHDANLSLKYADGTRVRLEGGAVVEVPAKATAGKRIYINAGDVSAQVAKQPNGRPMIFATPHADAIVRGTELYLHVRERQTQLEVAEGKVELVEHKTHDGQLVAAAETAVATTGSKIAKRGILWPTSREGLVYLFAGSKRPALARCGGVLAPTTIAPQGTGADWNALGQMELTGGWFRDAAAAAPIAQLLRENAGFSLEIVFTGKSLLEQQPQTIFALEATHSTLLAIIQKQDRLYFVSNVPALPLTNLPNEQMVELGSFAAETTTHLLISYQNQQWTIARQGTEVRTIPAGPLAWGTEPAKQIIFGGSAQEVVPRWQGTIAGLAIYQRALTPEEVNKSFSRFGQKE